MAWREGEPIVRREVWQGKPWLATIGFVVQDTADLPVSYLPQESRFGFPDGNWPGDGRHPWRWEPPPGWIAPQLPEGCDVV